MVRRGRLKQERREFLSCGIKRYMAPSGETWSGLSVEVRASNGEGEERRPGKKVSTLDKWGKRTDQTLLTGKRISEC